MIIVDQKIKVQIDEFANKNEEEIEEMKRTRINENLCSKLEHHLDEMSFLDMEPQDDGSVEISASVVLASTNDISTIIQRIATILREEYKFSAEAIEHILEPLAEDNKGW
jgi:hypothetical protein